MSGAGCTSSVCEVYDTYILVKSSNLGMECRYSRYRDCEIVALLRSTKLSR